MLLDANVLLYAHVEELPPHQAARNWLEAELQASAPIELAWIPTLAFVRVAMNPRVFTRPLRPADAWARAEDLLPLANVSMVEPGPRHAELLRTLMRDVVRRPDDVPDAHLAALAIEHDLTLASTDRDFARYPGLRWFDPLS